MQEIIITNQNGESITLGNQAPYFLETVDGVGEVPVALESQKAPKQDGSTYIDNTLENRAISIEGTIITKGHPAAVLAARRLMQRVLNPKSGEVTITYHQGNQVKEIMGIAETTPVFPGGSGSKGLYYQKFLLHLICHKPFWQDLIEGREEIALWVSDWEFPVEIPADGMEFGHRATTLIKNIINNGDVECGIRVEFRALSTVSNPSIFDFNSREFIKVKQDLVAGDKLIITTHFGNKRVELIKSDGTVKNVFNYIDLDSTFLQLQPGDNLLQYDAEQGIDNLEVSIYHRPLYLGI